MVRELKQHGSLENITGEFWIYVWTKCLSYQNLAENLLLRWNVQNIQHQTFCRRFVDIQWMPKNSGTGYEAEKLKELGFTVRELTDHYNAQEIMAAQFPKEWNVWVFACSFWGMHRDEPMFKRIWSASIIYTVYTTTRLHFFTALVVSLSWRTSCFTILWLSQSWNKAASWILEKRRIAWQPVETCRNAIAVKS